MIEVRSEIGCYDSALRFFGFIIIDKDCNRLNELPCLSSSFCTTTCRNVLWEAPILQVRFILIGWKLALDLSSL